MRAKRWVVFSTVVLSAVVVGGCAAGGEDRAGQVEAPQAGAVAEQPSAATAPEGEALEAAAVCIALGDVLTILENADLALADGRAEAQEHDGWYRLATRVLDRLPSGGDSAVHEAVGELQEIAPAVPAGAAAEAPGVRSDEWNDVESALGDACDDLDAPLTIAVFTGG